MARPRTIVYVDGFNLYYGAVRGTPWKWLDLSRLFTLLRPHDDIRLIRYFTSWVVGPTLPNQQAYISALSATPTVDVVFGKFKDKRVKCKVAACKATFDRHFDTREEKRTDVNIAVHMVDDAYQAACDQMILVSGDSDLIPGIKMVRSRFPSIRTVAYIPGNNPVRCFAAEMRSSVHAHRDLPIHLLTRAQLPNPVVLMDGSSVSKPADW